MSSFLTYLALAVMLAVVAVLVAGLRNMLVGGPGNRSQQLMRLRVMLQAIAVLIIVIFLVFSR
ncbi:twin transmembrane helix small protein [Aureimonas altamirensis]|uniref:twin transmembrane helix small protein n=1 Tax=Aureimonas altamirensis TaxID=370622 RepID=UPI001E4B023F|nr:twin transmembrane helix small protein [Aureimonas altamirensis]UHD45709.1 twin transmembrane helix small protein [Aureimonas altamirensis]